ncbi:hypothetical protein WMY93_022407 [Mugilogobius chulae]|uniref:Uncharacterized protein n=1 Tax=Mugilogobius chulae TaxID=88201 RepID=A0AAW0NBS8_9GOBI
MCCCCSEESHVTLDQNKICSCSDSSLTLWVSRRRFSRPRFSDESTFPGPRGSDGSSACSLHRRGSWMELSVSAECSDDLQIGSSGCSVGLVFFDKLLRKDVEEKVFCPAELDQNFTSEHESLEEAESEREEAESEREEAESEREEAGLSGRRRGLSWRGGVRRRKSRRRKNRRNKKPRPRAGEQQDLHRQDGSSSSSSDGLRPRAHNTQSLQAPRLEHLLHRLLLPSPLPPKTSLSPSPTPAAPHEELKPSGHEDGKSERESEEHDEDKDDPGHKDGNSERDLRNRRRKTKMTEMDIRILQLWSPDVSLCHVLHHHHHSKPCDCGRTAPPIVLPCPTNDSDKPAPTAPLCHLTTTTEFTPGTDYDFFTTAPSTSGFTRVSENDTHTSDSSSTESTEFTPGTDYDFFTTAPPSTTGFTRAVNDTAPTSESTSKPASRATTAILPITKNLNTIVLSTGPPQLFKPRALQVQSVLKTGTKCPPETSTSEASTSSISTPGGPTKTTQHKTSATGLSTSDGTRVSMTSALTTTECPPESSTSETSSVSISTPGGPTKTSASDASSAGISTPKGTSASLTTDTTTPECPPETSTSDSSTEIISTPGGSNKTTPHEASSAPGSSAPGSSAPGSSAPASSAPASSAGGTSAPLTTPECSPESSTSESSIVIISTPGGPVKKTPHEASSAPASSAPASSAGGTSAPLTTPDCSPESSSSESSTVILSTPGGPIKTTPHKASSAHTSAPEGSTTAPSSFESSNISVSTPGGPKSDLSSSGLTTSLEDFTTSDYLDSGSADDEFTSDSSTVSSTKLTPSGSTDDDYLTFIYTDWRFHHVHKTQDNLLCLQKTQDNFHKTQDELYHSKKTQDNLLHFQKTRDNFLHLQNTQDKLLHLQKTQDNLLQLHQKLHQFDVTQRLHLLLLHHHHARRLWHHPGLVCAFDPSGNLTQTPDCVTTYNTETTRAATTRQRMCWCPCQDGQQPQGTVDGNGQDREPSGPLHLTQQDREPLPLSGQTPASGDSGRGRDCERDGTMILCSCTKT